MGSGAMHRELIPSSNTSKAKIKQIQWVCTKELAMVTNEEIQKVLMSEGVHCNEQELNLVRDLMVELARIEYEFYQEQKNQGLCIENGKLDISNINNLKQAS
jgi:hypothetical protein